MFEYLDGIKKSIPECIKERIPNWVAMRTFGQSKILKSSYFWFVFVPICSKIIQHVPDLVAIGLPFSWKAMFFASVSFTLASILFSWRCPALIRDFAIPADFTAQGWTPYHIWRFVCDARKQEIPQRLVDRNYALPKVAEKDKNLKSYYNDVEFMNEFWRVHVPNDIKYIHQCIAEEEEERHRPSDCDMPENYIPYTPWNNDISNERFNMLFHGARYEMQEMFFWSRCLCSVLYLIGFLLVLWLAGENIWSVLKLILW